MLSGYCERIIWNGLKKKLELLATSNKFRTAEAKTEVSLAIRSFIPRKQECTCHNGTHYHLAAIIIIFSYRKNIYFILKFIKNNKLIDISNWWTVL